MSPTGFFVSADTGKWMFRVPGRGLLCQQRQSNQNAAQTYGFGVSLARYTIYIVGSACRTIAEVPMCSLQI